MTKPLRLLTIGHSHIVGMNRAMWRRLGEDSSFEITVAAPRFFRGDLRPLHIDPEPSGSSLRLVPLDAKWTQWIHIFQYDEQQLRKLMREGEFDVVHAWEEPYIYAGYQIANSLREMPSRLAFRTAQNLFKRYPPPFSYFERKAMNRAQAWIAGGNLVFQTMLKRGYPREKGWIRSLSVDLEDFHPASKEQKARVLEELGLKPPIIGFVGRLTEDKGIPVLMRALELLPKSLSWSALLLGSGPYKEKIDRWARRNGWQDRVCVKLVKHEEAPRYVAAMDLLAAPSQTTRHWREQFGRMIVEAFACRVPVIGSDSGEIPFVVADAGIIVPEKDSARWAGAIQDLLQDEAKRHVLGQRGGERVQMYSTMTASGQFAEFYRSLAEQPVALHGHGISKLERKSEGTSAHTACPDGAGKRRAAPLPQSQRTFRLVSIAHSYCVALNRRLAHELAVMGRGKVEVAAISPSYFHSDLRPVAAEGTEGEACNTEKIDAYFTRHIHVMLYGSRLKEILRGSWDLVHCWEEPYIFCGGQIAMWTPKRMPLVYWTCQNINKIYPPPFNWIEDYCVDRCSGWTALGELVKQTMLKRGYGEKPHAVMPLGVEVDHFYPNLEARQQTLQRLGWSGDRNVPVVGFLGRFVPEKGLDLLMRSLDEVSHPWRALLIGNGPMKRRLQHWAERYPDRVRILTTVKHAEVPQYLNAMDLLCAPSQTTWHWREQFGRMIIEAFACGVPVIASDSGEIPFVVGDAGLVLPEKGENAWSQTINALLHDPERRKELSQRGIDRVHKLYTWKIVAQKHLEFFDQVLQATSKN